MSKLARGAVRVKSTIDAATYFTDGKGVQHAHTHTYMSVHVLETRGKYSHLRLHFWKHPESQVIRIL